MTLNLIDKIALSGQPTSSDLTSRNKAWSASNKDEGGDSSAGRKVASGSRSTERSKLWKDLRKLDGSRICGSS